MGLAIKMGATTPIVVETPLWENPDPTANFAAQTVPVTQSVLNFDSIRIYFYNYTSLAVGPGYITIDLSQYDLFDSENAKLRFVIGYKNSSGTSYCRFGWFNGDSVNFGDTKQWNSTTTSNGNAMPYKITGISKKEIVIPSKGNETVKILWTNPTPNSALAGESTITLSEGLENYDFIRFLWKASTSDTVDVDSWADWYIGKDPTKLSNATNCEGVALSARSTGTTVYVRTLYVTNDTAPYTGIKISNGSRVANTTTNTSYVIPLVICGVNIVDAAKNRISKDISVLTTDWSSTTVVFAGEDCYYAEYDISDYDGHTPTINITSSTEEISIDSQKGYLVWKYATVDETTMKLRLYSTEVPAFDFEIHVEGVV